MNALIQSIYDYCHFGCISVDEELQPSNFNIQLYFDLKRELSECKNGIVQMMGLDNMLKDITQEQFIQCMNYIIANFQNMKPSYDIPLMLSKETVYTNECCYGKIELCQNPDYFQLPQTVRKVKREQIHDPEYGENNDEELFHKNDF